MCSSDLDVDTLSGLGSALLQGNQPAEALVVADQIIQMAPENAGAHSLACRALGQLAFPVSREPLLAELRRWVLVAPTDSAAWKQLAELLLRIGNPADHAEALRAAMRAVQCTQRKQASGLELLATVHAACGESLAAAAVRDELASLRADSSGR